MVALILLVGFGLRLAGLGNQGMWVDEGHTLDDVTWRTLPYLASLVGWGPTPTTLPGWADVHPPLYFLTLMPWVAVAGTSEVALRFPSVIWSVLTVAVLYRLVFELLGRRAAVLAALVATVSAFSVAYAQEARMYALLGFETTCATYFTARWLLKGDRRIRVGVGYVLAAATAVYTHYFAGLVLVSLNLVVLAAAGRRWIPAFAGMTKSGGQAPALPGVGSLPSEGQAPALRVFAWWAVMQVAVLVLLAPWVGVAVRQWTTYPGRETTPTPLAWAVGLAWFASNLGTALREDEGFFQVAAITLLFGVGLVLAARAREARPALAFLASMAVLPLALYVGVLVVQPHFHPRYVFPTILAYYGLLGAALAAYRVRSRWVGALAAASVAAASLSGVVLGTYNLPFLKDEAREVAFSLNQRASAREVVLSDAEEPLQHYYAGAGAFAVMTNRPETPRELQDLLKGRTGAWLVQWWQSTLDSAGLVPFLLGKYGQLDATEQWRGYRVLHYQVAPPPEVATGEEQSALGARFDPGLELVSGGYGSAAADLMLEGAVQSGGSVWAALRWRATGPSPDDAKAVVQVLDRAGNVVGQDDHQLLANDIVGTRGWKVGQEATTYHLIQTAIGAAPGSYRVQALLYWKASGERLRPQPGPLTRGDAVVLGAQNVAPPREPRLPVGGFTRVDQPLGADLTVLGFEPPRQVAGPGDELAPVVYWQAARVPAGNYGARLVLTGSDGRRQAGPPAPIAAEFPTTEWRSGEVVRSIPTLRVGPELEAGTYNLSIELAGEDGGTQSARLTEVRVNAGPAPQAATQTPEVTIHASVGPDIELVGYDLEANQVKPGSRLNLALYWTARGPLSGSYTVFVHMLDGANQVAAQHDGPPSGGNRPTAGWRPGEVIRDQHTIELPQTLRPGAYRLEVGMYDPRTLERLPMMASDLRVQDNALLLSDLVVG